MKQMPVCWLIFLLLCCSCAKEYSYEGGPRSLNYLAKDASGACSLLTVAGQYKAGVALDSSHYLLAWVHIGQKGAYVISSGKLNGYSFSASGTFADTGMVQLKLAASGTPDTAGSNTFRLTYDSTFCEVTVDVQKNLPLPVTSVNPDHFPLTADSRWVYDDLTFSGDSIITTMLRDTVIGSYTYKRVDEYRSFYPATNSRYYTKSALDYFRYTSVSTFTSAFNFSPSIYDDLNFLKENLTAGFTWRSNTYSGRTTLSAQVKLLRYSFQCIDANASLTVNNRLFNGVYKIQMLPEEANAGLPLQPSGEVHTFYYAKGIGLIYQEFFNGVLSHPVLAIRSWKVN